MNAIFNAISMEEFKRISNIEVAHTAWNILQTRSSYLCVIYIFAAMHDMIV